jgi:Reverse transcriptase (RNA-dependent DNA polymerase)
MIQVNGKWEITLAPNIDNIYRHLNRENFFACRFVLKQAFRQTIIAEESRPLTAFNIQGMGLFQCVRMPMGLRNAAATQSKLMDKVLGTDLHPYVFVYLDDIIIIGKSFEHQIQLIKEVATRLKEANLTVNRSKVQANLCRIRILGNILDRDGLHPDPVKVKAISEYKPPRNAKEVKRFLGVSGWFSRFIQDYSRIVSPLSKLLKKNTKFIWGIEEQTAFEATKTILSNDPVIRPPNWERPFIVQTD